MSDFELSSIFKDRNSFDFTAFSIKKLSLSDFELSSVFKDRDSFDFTAVESPHSRPLRMCRMNIYAAYVCEYFLANIFLNLDKYTVHIVQIHFAISTSTFCSRKSTFSGRISLHERHIKSAKNSNIENLYEKMQSRKGSRTCLCYLYFNLSNFNFASSAMLCDDAMTMLLFCRRVLMIALRR